MQSFDTYLHSWLLDRYQRSRNGVLELGRVTLSKTMDTEDQKPKQEIEKMKDAITNSNDILISAKTTLALFPDTLCVDREKIEVTKRKFFRSSEVFSMRIEDTLSVGVTLGPVLGSIKITSRVMNTDSPSITVGLFWRTEAIKIKRIIQGYVIAIQNKIDCKVLPTNELLKVLEELGVNGHPS